MKFSNYTNCIIVSKTSVRYVQVERIEIGMRVEGSKVAADLKINAGTIANYENGIRQAPYDYLIKFADYYGVSLDYILGRENYETPVRAAQTLSAAEMQLIADYRKSGQLGKSRIAEYAQLWAERSQTGT